MPMKGSCLCGGMEYEAGGMCFGDWACSCGNCRKWSGSAFSTGTAVLSHHFRWVKGESLLASTPVVVLSAILGRTPKIEEYKAAVEGIDLTKFAPPATPENTRSAPLLGDRSRPVRRQDSLALAAHPYSKYDLGERQTKASRELPLSSSHFPPGTALIITPSRRKSSS